MAFVLLALLSDLLILSKRISKLSAAFSAANAKKSIPIKMLFFNGVFIQFKYANAVPKMEPRNI